ncbi:PpiC-type peptidyl-prolyl cis-trans isomerase [Oceanicola granulosus HTCC2516]|uniref:Parvulin-like PPIase n=1 Tax=Oceanicola granulosus (strain ATCC BAA-861 / DSM 15982 / KCTC 12143 / HTCC2516) TaxID=314256 RepID=Q2CJX7_OCEGH|nr:peptidylprolyl isomerase [Oceanicola granulosus]EAR53012.1 PpiC-type peptidyl-prolyl cis-trans isomerase [Oceanicola granulosus HTCC2516]
MSRTLRLLASATLAAGLSTAAVAQEASDVVATVNGTDITLGELIIAKAQLPQQYQQLPDDVLFDGLVDQLIQQQLLSDQLDASPERVQLALKNEERSLRAGEAITRITEEAVSEEALQAAYEARFADAEPQTEYNASHILVETEEEAVALTEQARAEGADFAELARENSTGPSGPAGGELGWFGEGMMVQEFYDAVVALEPGDVSEPVQTQFGWHVIKLNETRLSEVPPLESLRGELTSELQQQAVEDALAELEAGADVTRPEQGAFDPAALSDFSILEN